jgi:hypothetical protein
MVDKIREFDVRLTLNSWTFRGLFYKGNKSFSLLVLLKKGYE